MRKQAIPLIYSVVAACSLLAGAGSLRAEPPVVAGFERLRDKADPALQGELLLNELNCVSCHKPEGASAERFSIRQAPDLRQAGSRITPQYLEQYLANPQSVKPGAVMPNLLHAATPEQSRETVDALVHYLVAQGGPISSSQMGGSERLVELGRELFHTVGCAACHAPETTQTVSTPSVPLPKLALKTTVDQLAAFLVDPSRSHPSSRMPSLRLSPEEARSLAVYLLREQLTNPQSAAAGKGKTPGVSWEYYEISPSSTLPDFSTLTPKAKGTVPTFTLDIPTGKRESNYALRFKGIIVVPQTGRYRFATRSDDGSKLFINGKMVVDNDGTHGEVRKVGQIELTAGEHDIEVTFFQDAGGASLGVTWSGPGVSERGQDIPAEALWNASGEPMVPLASRPFTVDPAKVELGRQKFSALGCAACHQMDGVGNSLSAKSLASLNSESSSGCLSASVAKGLPKYDLSAPQRSAIKAALNNKAQWPQALAPEHRVTRTLATLNCYACHDRDGIGGPDTVRAEFFKAKEDVDLGEEGKIPPTLTGVGAKLKPQALKRILSTNDLHVRDYMLTRMPSFSETAVEPIATHIATVDRKQKPGAAPAFSEESWKIGHQMVGIGGVSCIACHRVSDAPSIGIQGIDLARVYERLDADWFKQFLLNPLAFKKETRMPQFWPEGKSLVPNVANGSTERQIDGIWAYLSLQKSMPLPQGMKPAGSIGMELVPGTEPIIHRTFMKDVGPRSIIVGFPEKVHVAFDGNQVRLAQAWRGRFFDGSGVASGRTDTFMGPLGEDILDLPAGPAFAVLESQNTPWPVAEKLGRNSGGHFRGYSLDGQRRPIFRYSLGGITIEEQPVPIVQPGGSIFSRQFKFQAPQDAGRSLYFLAGAGQQIEKQSDGSYLIDGRMNVLLKSGAALEPVVRTQPTRKELLVPVPFQNGAANLEALIRW